MTENHVWSIVLLALMLFITSCEFERIIETTSEEWIAIVNIDGTNLQYICRGTETPYFVPDSENPEQELLMLDCSTHIDLINIDGSNRRTVIDSVGTIHSFSEDRKKMLLNRDGEVYIANTDGTALQNLTNTPDVWERDPSFSPSESRVIYHTINFSDSTSFIATIDLATLQHQILIEEPHTIDYWMSFASPIFSDESNIFFGQHYTDTLHTDGLYSYNIDNGEKELIDPGSISKRIIYCKNKNRVTYAIYEESSFLKHYDLITDIIVKYGVCDYFLKPNLDRKGALLAVDSYIYNTETIEMYDVLKFYGDDADAGKTVDFNNFSTKVVMALRRYFPSSN